MPRSATIQPCGKWSPSDFLALTTLIEDQGGRYQVCGPSAFYRYGWDNQIPNRLYAYNHRITGERKKVHSDFYRMSEDLDFAFSVPLDALPLPAERNDRADEGTSGEAGNAAGLLQCRRCTSGIQSLDAVHRGPELQDRGNRPGRVDQRRIQHSGTDSGTAEALARATLSIDPFRQAAAVAPVEVPVLSCRETYAEKLRAASTRREPAIRDFYDIDHGVRSGRLKTERRNCWSRTRSTATSSTRPFDRKQQPGNYGIFAPITAFVRYSVRRYERVCISGAVLRKMPFTRLSSF